MTFVGAMRGWANRYGVDGAISIVGTGDGGRTWATEIAADGMIAATGFVTAADRVWLLTAVGIQGGSDRSTIYRRDFAPEQAPPATRIVRPPNTGTGSDDSASDALALTVLLVGAGILSAGAGAAASRPANTP